ncbi:MAG TPA: hypothetical protein VGG99_08100 [Acetobacteraceae bacterium]
MPEWLAYLIALVILFLLEQFQAIGQRHPPRPASRPVGRPALPQDPAAAPATKIHNHSDDPAARTRRSRDTAPEPLDLAHARAALLEKLRQSDIDPSVLSQLEALGIVPGPIGPDTAATPVLSPLCAAKIRGAPRRSAPLGPRHVVSRTPWRQIAHPGTGPPTGPPVISRCQSCYA